MYQNLLIRELIRTRIKPQYNPIAQAWIDFENLLPLNSYREAENYRMLIPKMELVS